jgi:hypothetical protein
VCSGEVEDERKSRQEHSVRVSEKGDNIMRLEVAYEIAPTCQEEACDKAPTHVVRLDNGIYFLCAKHALDQYPSDDNPDL